MSFIPKVLIIAGSDSGGGAGIQADIKAITYFKGYAMTAVTAITAQNTVGVQSIFPLPKEIVIEQINSVTNDLEPDIVKIGMLADEEIINHISINVSDYKIVLDPVMVATSGDVLVSDEIINSIKDKLINKSLDFIKLTSKNSINVKNKANYTFVNGDEDQLNRVFINLIKNSEESFIDQLQKKANFKGNIDIEIDDNNDYIVIRLIDNGTGITDSKKAMTPYFTTKKTGTGLGLPIVTKIINEHNGSFSIKKSKDNKGTIVTISLPKYA